MTLTIQIQNQKFTLHQSGAVFWQEQNMLLISDVHIGKVAHFRKNGMAIPGNVVFENFHRMSKVVSYFNPEQLVFLGDLFHSKINNEWELFTDWVRSTAAKIILIEGNHDIIAKYRYADLNIAVLSEWIIGDFLLTHHPEESEGLFNFCGHIHPGIVLRGSGRQSLKLPCFFQKEKQLILPAFGEFTGNYYLVPTTNDVVYVITDEEVIRISN